MDPRERLCRLLVVINQKCLRDGQVNRMAIGVDWIATKRLQQIIQQRQRRGSLSVRP